MQEMRKFSAPEIITGSSARLLAGRSAQNLGGTRALVVTDPGVERAGWAEDIVKSLQAEDIGCVIVDRVSQNPRDHEVAEASAVYRESSCDIIVAVGGGSPMDAAKAIGILVSNGGAIADYEGVDKVRNPMPPLICVPTTAGTAADLSQFAIINNTTEKKKMAIISKAVIPDIALLDPEVLVSMDPYLTACTGVDALVHAVEAYVSLGAGHLTDLYARDAIALIARSLPVSVERPDDLEARMNMLLACMEAGLAFSNAGLGAVHALAHSLGGLLDLPHGECNALLLPEVARVNYSAASGRYDHIMQLMGIAASGADAVAAAFAAFAERVGIRGNIGARGLTMADVPSVARLGCNDPCMATNPVPVEPALAEAILRAAL